MVSENGKIQALYKIANKLDDNGEEASNAADGGIVEALDRIALGLQSPAAERAEQAAEDALAAAVRAENAAATAATRNYGVDIVDTGLVFTSNS